MKLLLFLSALLTAMTGVVVGEAPSSAAVHATAPTADGLTVDRVRPAARAGVYPGVSAPARVPLAPPFSSEVGPSGGGLRRVPIYREKPRE